MTLILWTVLCFLSGSLMFSYWLGLLAKHNLQEHGDGNPGAVNLWRAAGVTYGLSGIVLDFLKGYLPVFLLVYTDTLSGYEVVAPSFAALLGHVFSPFLRGRGGKGIAVTFGVWSALTGFTASLAYAVILATLLVIARWLSKGKKISSETDGFQVVLGMLLLSIYLYVLDYSYPILAFWIANFFLLVFSHRKELYRFLTFKVEDQKYKEHL